MKKIILHFLLLLTAFTAATQTAPAIQWQNAIGGKHAGIVTKMTPTNDGGYIVVGWVDTTNNLGVTNYHRNTDVWVAKLDGHCNIIWQKCYGGSGDEWGYKAMQTKDGGYIITGLTGSNDGDVTGNHGGGDIWVFKLDESGKLIWQKCFGGSKEDDPNAIIQTNDGGYIVAGQTLSNDGDVTGFHFIWPNLNYDGWVIKMDSVGNLEWEKCLGGSGDDGMYDILQNADNSYMLAGAASSNDGDVTGFHGYVDAWLVKLNTKGVIQWEKCLGGTGLDNALAIIKTKDKGYIIGGETTSNDGDVSGCHGSGDDWFVKIDSIGNIQWQKCFGGSKLENFDALQSTKDKGFVFCGASRSNDGDVSGNHGAGDYWVVKTDSTGTIIWQRCLGGSNGDEAFNIYETSEGGFIVAGYSETQPNDGDVLIHYYLGNNKYNDDCWIVKLGAEPQAINVVYNNNQLQIYPNPAHNYIGIQTDNIKEIRIMDIGGRQYLHKQITDTIAAYTYMNIQFLASGIYIYYSQ